MRDFHIEFGAPADGWMTIKVVEGDQEWQRDVSDVPRDSIRSFISSLSMLIQGSTETTVDWSLEPDYAQWRFLKNGSSVDFVIKDSQRANPRLIYRGSVCDVVHRMMKALGDLAAAPCWSDSKRSGAEWSWPFPEPELLRLRTTWVATCHGPSREIR